MNELSPWPNWRFGAAEGAQYLAFVVEAVKPFVDERYRTRSDAASTAIIGRSMGGLISHAAIHRYPQVFGKAALFSPSYWFAPPVFDETRSRPLPADTRVYLYMGGKEGAEALADVRRMHTLMAQRMDPAPPAPERAGAGRAQRGGVARRAAAGADLVVRVAAAPVVDAGHEGAIRFT